MIKQINKYIWLTPIFILIQIYVLNQVLFNGFSNPYIYIILIICLPQNTSRWLLLSFAFILGILVDSFEISLGIHSTACVLIAFIKPSIERIIIPRNTISEEDDLFLQKLGYKIFSIYSFFMILIHHSTLFLLVHFNIETLLKDVWKIILSSFITFIIIFICQFFFFKRNKRE